LGNAKKSRAQSNQRSKRPNQVTEETLQYLQSELTKYWDAYNVEVYHRNVFKDCVEGLSLELCSPIIAKEIQDMQNEKAPILKVMKAVLAREECLKNIFEMNTFISSNPQSVNSESINEAVELLHSLRMLTIHVVEQIIKWREQLYYAYQLSNSENS
jgi:hypothetical protein